jgi:hypothetical protein
MLDYLAHDKIGTMIVTPRGLGLSYTTLNVFRSHL